MAGLRLRKASPFDRLPKAQSGVVGLRKVSSTGCFIRGHMIVLANGFFGYGFHDLVHRAFVFKFDFGFGRVPFTSICAGSISICNT